MKESKSQLRQDLLVLAILNFKKGGFYVEFGATDGKSLSNTYILEKIYGWKGILAEPAGIWQRELIGNRPNATLVNEAVWSETGLQLIFKETARAEYSTLKRFSGKDHHASIRKQGLEYKVSTISLNDLLKRAHVPRDLDYLSIDTEGSEFEILRTFDFESYRFSVITCEHNFGKDRSKIFDLLILNGYKRIFPDVSRFDDWYVLTEIEI
jgi:FkbM family methyltransferase